MEVSPTLAAISLAASSLVYFIALPLAQWTWRQCGFSRALLGWTCLAVTAYALPFFEARSLAWLLPVGSMGAAAAYGLAETYLIERLSLENRAHEFGQARKWGSLGFLLAAGLGGLLLDAWGGMQHFEALLGLVALLFFVSAGVLAFAERGTPFIEGARLNEDALNLGEQAPATLSDVREWPLSPPSGSSRPSSPFLWIALLGIVFQRVAENQTTAWFGAYWIATGHHVTEAGFLNAWSVFSEFVAMGLTASALGRMNLPWVMMWSCLISAFRWAATPFCTDLWCAIPLQSVHALSFGLFYPASLIWIRSQWPDQFFNTRYVMEGGVRILSSGYYYLAAGTLIPVMGFVPVFEGCAVFALLGAVVWWRPGFSRGAKARA